MYRLDFPPHLDVVPHHVPAACVPPHTVDEEYLAGTHRQMVESPPPFENFEQLVERFVQKKLSNVFNPIWEEVQILWIGGGGAKSAPPLRNQ